MENESFEIHLTPLLRKSQELSKKKSKVPVAKLTRLLLSLPDHV